MNGATSVAPDNQEINAGGKAIEPTAPTWDGYNFKGWSLGLEDEGYFDFNTIITSNITLYADWEMISSGDGEEGTYYSGITITSGESLINQLNALISIVTAGNGTQNSSYGEVRYILEKSDINPNNTDYLWGIYDNANIPKIWDGTTMNREHVWPNSRLGVPRNTLTNSSRRIDSDPHNLRIIIPETNRNRSNFLFVNSEPSANGYVILGTDTYYPGNDHRGDVARILLYMAVRYKDILILDESMYGDNYSLSGTSFGNIKVLLQWHQDDPVDAFEIQRNNVIHSHQGNRNPFIDRPEYFQPVWEYFMQQAGLQALAIETMKNTIAAYELNATRYVELERQYI